MGGVADGRLYGQSMAESGLDAAFIERSLFDALIDIAEADPDLAAIEDQNRQPVTRRNLLLAACVLGCRLASFSRKGERVGLLLPNVNGVAIAFFALLAYGRTPALLNFTAGSHGLGGAIRVGAIRTVITSSAFVKTAKLEPVIDDLKDKVRIVYLEDVRAGLSLFDKAVGATYARWARALHRPYRRAPRDIAAVLFTSGTEGAPKGVGLTATNFLSNVAQILALYEFYPEDTLFNALPVFHSYGLTAGLFLPVFGRFKSFLYPSPLHYKIIPGLVRDSGSTVLLSTDTFAAGWARSAEDGDFNSVRLTILGAERVKEQTRALWMDRFGVVLNEGYGATECAPVLSVNYPGSFRDGTVGRLLPGIEARLDPVPGLEIGGRLHVRAPNIMAGYYLADRPGELVRNDPDGWYDTGDIVSIDDDGFVTLLGRAKRFAKVGGEMISLAAVEAFAAALWPNSSHAVVAISDPRKGEALVLVTDAGDASVEALSAYAREHGVPELQVPRKIVKTYALPVLGTGKMDLAAIEQMARS